MPWTTKTITAITAITALNICRGSAVLLPLQANFTINKPTTQLAQVGFVCEYRFLYYPLILLSSTGTISLRKLPKLPASISARIRAIRLL